MPKIAFLGAGSTVFAKNVLGDCMLVPSLRESRIALYDVDPTRLEQSRRMLEVLNRNVNEGRATITTHLGRRNLRAALQGANYVVNAVRVGGYKPATVTDFAVPKKYGLRQTIADTLGIGGIFRALRTIPVVLDFAREMEKVCPDAWFLNYVNPMAVITGALLRGSSIRGVGLCHSVQGCARGLLMVTGVDDGPGFKNLQWKVAGINHMGWLLEISHEGLDLYPEIKARYAGARPVLRKKGALRVKADAMKKHGSDWWMKDHVARMACDHVRLEIMHQFGYYVTESSEHNSEYMPYWIKSQAPELIDQFGIPLDEYLRRCVNNARRWKRMGRDLTQNPDLTHERTDEFAAYIMDAMETDVPARIAGNVINDDLIPNLPRAACVEVACLVDRNGVQSCRAGDLPEPCAALNRTNINVQLLTIEAALTLRKDRIYQAAMLDPHTSAELTIDRIRDLCDDMIAAHGRLLPEYK